MSDDRREDLERGAAGWLPDGPYRLPDLVLASNFPFHFWDGARFIRNGSEAGSGPGLWFCFCLSPWSNASLFFFRVEDLPAPAGVRRVLYHERIEYPDRGREDSCGLFG